MSEKITLVCTPLRFYSKNDEALMFEWLKKIKCINDIKGIGRELHLYISPSNISDNDLVDLMGLFKRYKFKDESQLVVFKNKKNEKWFDD